MIVVGAVGPDDTAPDFSNWSSEYVHLAAPGFDILSAYPYGVPGDPPKKPEDGYNTIERTSMAAPHVAGAVALVASVSPDSTANELKNILLKSANPNINPEAPATVEVGGQKVKLDPQGGVRGHVVSKYGLLDVKAAIDLATTKDSLDDPNEIVKRGGGGCDAMGVLGYGMAALALVLWLRKRKVK